jgi:hypothetical protein
MRLRVRRIVRRRRRASEPRPWPSEAVASRSAYQSRLRELVACGIRNGPPVALHVFSFSSEERLPEQMASLRSFLANAGTPTEFTIVSEGNHCPESRGLLRAVHPCVSIVDWDRFVAPDVPRVVRDYAEWGWQGKQLAALISLPRDRPVLYTDSDILFFPAAAELRDLSGEAGPRYLRDCDGRRPFLDLRLLRDEREAEEGVNAGFFFHPEGLDWTPALDRLKRLRERPRSFTGQTVLHLTMHDCRARPFDRSRCVMTTGDRSRLEDPYARPDTVLRHYVTPVRHKFWITLSRFPTLHGVP